MAEERIGLEGHFDLTQWNRAMDTYMADIGRMNAGTAAVAAAIGAQYAKLGGAIVTSLGLVTAAVGAVAVLGGKALVDWTMEGVKGAVDFEQRVADIGAVLGKTTDEIKPLADAINELALDPGLVVSTNEAADAIEMLARNGLEMDEIIGGAARSVVLLANATGGEFSTAADVATDMLAQFNLEVGDLPHAVDLAQGVINNSKFTLDDWSLALAQAGGAAGALGVEVDDFAVILAGIAPLFASGSDAGTSFKTFLQRLVPQSKEAEGAMRDLGLYTDETGSAFFDAEGNMKSMGKIATLLQEKLGYLSEEQLNQAMTTLFGQDAMRAAIGVMNLGGQAFDDLATQVGRAGSAEEAAATRTDTLKAKMQILADQWEATQRNSGAQFEDLLKRIVAVLVEFTSANSEKIIAFFAAFAEMLGAVWARLEPLVVDGLPKMVSNLEAMARWLIEVAAGGGTANEWLAQMSPGLATFVERVVGVVTALRDFKAWLDALFARVGEVLQPLRDWIAEHVTLNDALIAAGGAVAAFLAPLVLAIAQMAAVGAAAAVAVAAIRKAWEEDLGGVREFVAQTWEQIKGIVETGSAIVAQVFGESGGKLKGVASTVWEGIKTVISTTLAAIQGVLYAVLLIMEGDWKAAWTTIDATARLVWGVLKDLWQTTLDALVNILSTASKPIITWFEETFPAAAETARDEMTDIEEAWARMWEAMTSETKTSGELVTKQLDADFSIMTTVVSNAIELILGLFTTWILFLKGDWAAAWEQVKINWGVLWDTMTAVFKNAWITFKNLATAGLNALDAQFGNMFRQMVTTVTTALSEMVTAAGQKIQELITAITTPLQNLRQTFFDFGKNAVQGFIDGLGSLIGSATAKVQELLGLSAQAAETKAEIQSPSKVFKRIGEMTGLGFTLGLGDELAKVTNIWQTAMGAMAQAAQADAGMTPAASLAGQMGGRVAAMQSAVSPVYNTSSSTNFGPVNVYTPMDLAEFEFRVRRIVGGMI